MYDIVLCPTYGWGMKKTKRILITDNMYKLGCVAKHSIQHTCYKNTRLKSMRALLLMSYCIAHNRTLFWVVSNKKLNCIILMINIHHALYYKCNFNDLLCNLCHILCSFSVLGWTNWLWQLCHHGPSLGCDWLNAADSVNF